MEPPYDAIRETPEDDDPRLAWARAVGGERGELVEVQCRLARSIPRSERKALRAREVKLLATFLESWREQVKVGGPTLRRGFVDRLWIPLEEFLAHTETILGHAPLLRVLHLESIGIDVSRFHVNRCDSSPEAEWKARAALLEEAFRRLSATPVQSLELGLAYVSISGDWDEPSVVTSFGDDAARVVAGAPSLAGLRSLELVGGPTVAAIDALGALPLDEFRAPGNRFDAGAALDLMRRFPRLTRLGLSPGPVGGSLGEFLDAPEAARLTALQLQPLDDDDLRRIASAPCLASLRDLDLRYSEAVTAKGLRALAESPHLRLRSFRLHSGRMDDLASIEASPAFASVKELNLNSCKLDERAIPVLRTLPDLEYVGLAGSTNRMPADTREQLEAVPEVHFNPPSPPGGPSPLDLWRRKQSAGT